MNPLKCHTVWSLQSGLIKTSLEDPTAALRIKQNELKRPLKVKFPPWCASCCFFGCYSLCVFLLRACRETADEAAGPHLAPHWSRMINTWRFTGTSEQQQQRQQCETARTLHPPGITRLCKNQSVNFWGKYTRDWLSRQNRSFQHYCRSQSHSPNTRSRYSGAGAPDTQSPQKCSLVLGGKCGTIECCRQNTHCVHEIQLKCLWKSCQQIPACPL